MRSAIGLWGRSTCSDQVAQGRKVEGNPSPIGAQAGESMCRSGSVELDQVPRGRRWPSSQRTCAEARRGMAAEVDLHGRREPSEPMTHPPGSASQERGLGEVHLAGPDRLHPAGPASGPSRRQTAAGLPGERAQSAKASTWMMRQRHGRGPRETRRENFDFAPDDRSRSRVREGTGWDREIGDNSGNDTSFRSRPGRMLTSASTGLPPRTRGRSVQVPCSQVQYGSLPASATGHRHPLRLSLPDWRHTQIDSRGTCLVEASSTVRRHAMIGRRAARPGSPARRSPMTIWKRRRPRPRKRKVGPNDEIIASA